MLRLAASWALSIWYETNGHSELNICPFEHKAWALREYNMDFRWNGAPSQTQVSCCVWKENRIVYSYPFWRHISCKIYGQRPILYATRKSLHILFVLDDGVKRRTRLKWNEFNILYGERIKRTIPFLVGTVCRGISNMRLYLPSLCTIHYRPHVRHTYSTHCSRERERERRFFTS